MAHGSAGKRRLIRAEGSASRISNTSSSTDHGGGGFATLTKQNKPAWVSPVVHPGLPCWSPSEQSYTLLGHPQVTQPPELFGGGGAVGALPSRPGHSYCFGEGIRAVADQDFWTSGRSREDAARRKRTESFRGGPDAVLLLEGFV